jgi:hypothetical protein
VKPRGAFDLDQLFAKVQQEKAEQLANRLSGERRSSRIAGAGNSDSTGREEQA